jgi:phosphoribosylglycinamide formyltransferase-1
MSQPHIKLAIFASGAGSNAQKLIEYFGAEGAGDQKINIGLVVSNKQEAGVLKIATANQIPTLIIDKDPFFKGDAYVGELQGAGIDFIVLAGFLWKVPAKLIQAYPGAIVNIHPALLPKYGGKGMYGHFVHEAVINNKDLESGITIHLVDEQYDHGAHLFQATCPVLADDTANTLAARIHQLEHAHYAQVIEKAVKAAFPEIL